MSNEIPVTPSLNTQLANAVADVAKAQDQLIDAQREVSRARSRECDAINRVNVAQKHFDVLVAEVKKSAPRDTDWQRVGLKTNAV
jgi:hypothetical protein